MQGNKLQAHTTYTNSWRKQYIQNTKGMTIVMSGSYGAAILFLYTLQLPGDE